MIKAPYKKETFYHWTEIAVRFSDLDPLNHVNNAVFNSYLEEARIQFLNDIGQLESEFSSGKSFVLVKCTLEYLKQITYPSTILVGTGVGKVGNSSIEALQAIYDKKSQELLCIGSTIGVWFDLKTQRPTRLPEIENLEEMMVNREE